MLLRSRWSPRQSHIICKKQGFSRSLKQELIRSQTESPRSLLSDLSSGSYQMPATSQGSQTGPSPRRYLRAPGLPTRKYFSIIPGQSQHQVTQETTLVPSEAQVEPSSTTTLGHPASPGRGPAALRVVLPPIPQLRAGRAPTPPAPSQGPCRGRGVK